MYNLIWQQGDDIVAYQLRKLLTGSKTASFLASQTLKRHFNTVPQNTPSLKETCKKLV